MPLGVLLSGGIDSAAVTGMLARMPGRVKTFTVGFDTGGTEGELAEARAVARHFGTDHHEVIWGRPWPTRCPASCGCRTSRSRIRPRSRRSTSVSFAARSVKVVLTGEGGDELLGGYPRYAWLRLGEQLRRWPGATCRGLRATARDAARRPLRADRAARRAPSSGAPRCSTATSTWVATMSDDAQQAVAGPPAGRRPVRGWRALEPRDAAIRFTS